MKTVGIIGGLGPETTSEFYLQVIFSCYERDTSQRPPILMWSVPLEYQIEDDLITRVAGEERYLPYLLNAARRLESGGADFIVMPCNSLHIYLDEIRNSVKIPVLSILEATANFLKAKGVKEVGLLATSITVNHKLYEKCLHAVGIEQILPDISEQEMISRMINKLVLKRHDSSDREELIKIITNFSKKDIATVILACTDLQLLVPTVEHIRIYDTMKILADATVREILGTS